VKIKATTGTSKTPRPHRERRSPARTALHIDRARDLRQTETESEQAAWRLLRTLKLDGFKFRRQHPVGQYIVDFCCPQRHLVVELDGSVHGQPGQAKRDTCRDTRLENMGYTVARFSNGMVLKAPEIFVAEVLRLAWSLPEAFGSQP